MRPATSERSPPVLVRALNSESNELRQDYEARYGPLAATDRPA